MSFLSESVMVYRLGDKEPIGRFVYNDTVDHPAHYNKQVPGIECIQVVRHFNFNRGNAIKYIWRAGYKGDGIEDLRKAIWYLEDEIGRMSEENEDRTG